MQIVLSGTNGMRARSYLKRNSCNLKSLENLSAAYINYERPICYTYIHFRNLYTSCLEVENWINFEFAPRWCVYIFDAEFCDRMTYYFGNNITNQKSDSLFFFNEISLNYFKYFHIFSWTYNFIKISNFYAHLFFVCFFANKNVQHVFWLLFDILKSIIVKIFWILYVYWNKYTFLSQNTYVFFKRNKFMTFLSRDQHIYSTSHRKQQSVYHYLKALEGFCYFLLTWFDEFAVAVDSIIQISAIIHLSR